MRDEIELDQFKAQLEISLKEMKQILLEKKPLLFELRTLLPTSLEDEQSWQKSGFIETLRMTERGKNLEEPELVELADRFQNLFREFLETDTVIGACLQVLGLDENLSDFDYSKNELRGQDTTLSIFAGQFVKAYPIWKKLLTQLEESVTLDDLIQKPQSLDAFFEDNQIESSDANFLNYALPNPDIDAPLTSMSHATYHELRTKLVHRKNFQESPGTPWPTLLLSKGGAVGNAQLRPPVIENQPLMPPDEVQHWVNVMWRHREELSDLDADALDLLCHTWLQQARRPNDSALAVVDHFLLMRGLKPKQSGSGRRGGFEPEQRSDMLRALSHIQSLWLNMGSVEVYEEQEQDDEDKSNKAELKNQYPRRKSKAVKKTIESRAFVVTDRMGQLNMDGYMDVERFIYQPGKLFAQFLFGPGRQTALLSAKAIQYDPYRQRWEKRLARYFSWQWRIKARSGDYSRPYRVATLLEAVEEELNIQRPGVTRERLEKALEMLMDDRVIASWQYDRWDEKHAEGRGWAKIWLEATIMVEPPAEIQETYKHIEHQEAKKNNRFGKKSLNNGSVTSSKPDTFGAKQTESNRPNSQNQPNEQLNLRSENTIDKAATLGANLKITRKVRHLSQSQVAEQLQIVQSYLSKIENEVVKPTPELEARIISWLVEG